jgi:hypothetical protein
VVALVLVTVTDKQLDQVLLKNCFSGHCYKRVQLLSVCLTNVSWSESVTSENYARKLASELLNTEIIVFPFETAQT